MNRLIFDVGGSNIKFALMSPEGEILEHKKIPTPWSGVEDYLNAFVTLAQDYQGQVDGVGISTNGRMMPDGNTYRAYTADYLTGLNIKEELEARLGLPVAVENDGEAAAIGEWQYGAGRGTNTSLTIVLGSGMGAGMVVDGKPWRGVKRNGSMVFGQLTTSVPAEDRYTISGIETGFMFVLMQMAGAKQMPMDQMTGEYFFQLVAQGDPLACGLLANYCKGVAITIFNDALLLDPDMVIVTGGLAEQPMLIQMIHDALKEISKNCLTFQGMDLTQIPGVGIDLSDFDIDFVKGELCLDANLYGALYCINELLAQ